MKKICLVLWTLMFSFAFSAVEIKDSGLIQLGDYKKINCFSAKTKIFVDKKEHSKYKNELNKEEYQIYLIADRILRANNLQHKNWRIGFRMDKDVVNAVSINNNLILINSSLYDCINQNDDALAFVIAHELAHFVLAHQKTTIENSYRIKRVEDEIKKIENNQSLKNKNINQYTALSRNLKNLLNNIFISQRNLELLADSQALEFLVRAGYSFDSALEVFDYIEEDYNFYENKNFYPLIYERKDNLQKEYEILNIDILTLEGKTNLSKSDVLSIRRSMDKETLVINKPKNYKEYSFSPKTKAQKLSQKAYYYYKKKELDKAVEYFMLAQKENPNDYIVPLYLSYCFEYLYSQNGNKKDLKNAKKYAKKAHQLSSKNEYALKQYKVFYKR